MRPELLNNSLFLKYYHQWLSDPKSIVFAPLAEIFAAYDMIDEALKVCREGLKANPTSVAGRLSYAKTLMKIGDLDAADAELVRVQEFVPSHSKALDLRMDIEFMRRGETPQPRAPVMISPQETVPAAQDAVPPQEEVPPLATATMCATDEDDDEERATESSAGDLPAWQTVTMARIFMTQGHLDRARGIYHAILSRDPSHEEARNDLNSLNAHG